MKKFILTGALALALSFAGSAQASTLADALAALGLSQSQIDMVVAASGSTSVSTGASMLSDHNGVNLRVGSRGTRVAELQRCMNSAGFNTGVVDGIYGRNTAAGVMSFQRSQGLAVDGVVGVQTTPAFQAACPVTTTVVVEDDMDDEDDSSDFDSSNGEEAEITTIEVDEGDDDDLQNDTSEQEAFTFTVEVDEDGGDLQIERVDLKFAVVVDGALASPEDDLWDIIEAITIEVDGDEVASEDTDDKDDWRGSDDQFRLSGIDTIIEADEEVEFTVLLDIADLDEDDDLGTGMDIQLVDVEVRYTDEAGITDTETASGTSTDTATATIEAKDVFELDFDESNDNPDEDYTLSLDEDVDMETLLIADVEVDGQDGVLEDVDVTVVVTGGEASEDSDDFLAELYFFVDGDEIDSDDAEVTLDGSGNGTIVFSFDLDDMEVEDEDEFEIEIKADFKELNDDADHSGATVQVTLVQFDGEDSEGDDVDLMKVDYDSSSDAAIVTISGGALVLEDSSVDGYNEIGSDDNAAKVKFEVEVMADGDEDITLDALAGGAGAVPADAYDAFVFEIDGVDYTGNSLPAGYTISIEDSNGDDLSVDGELEINDGSTETYEITIIVDATVTTVTGEYEIELSEITWVEDLSGTPTTGSLEIGLESDEIDLLNA